MELVVGDGGFLKIIERVEKQVDIKMCYMTLDHLKNLLDAEDSHKLDFSKEEDRLKFLGMCVKHAKVRSA